MTTIASRYRNTSIISGSYYATFDFPSDQLKKIPTFNIRTTSMDRLDTLASRYLGSGEYWWIIAMINNIEWAFDFVSGDILKIPVNVQDVLKNI